MLARLVPTSDRRSMPWDAIPWKPRIHLGLFVHRVAGATPGLYALARDPDKVETLRAVLRGDFLWQRPPTCPSGLHLYLLKEGDCHALAASVSCGQDIAGDGAFSLGMIADYMDSLVTYGAAFYRNLFLGSRDGWSSTVSRSRGGRYSIDRHRLLFRRSSSRGIRIVSRDWQSFLPFYGRWPGGGRAAHNLARLWPRERESSGPNGTALLSYDRGLVTAIQLGRRRQWRQPCVAQASSFDHAGGTVAPRLEVTNPVEDQLAVFHSPALIPPKPTRATPPPSSAKTI